MSSARQREADERSRERRRREDAAPRLGNAIPNLRTLRLEISHHRGGREIPECAYTRLVVIARASALVLVPCGDPTCVGGDHDVSGAILGALRRGETTFSISDACRGVLGVAEVPCSASVTVVGNATYQLRTRFCSLHRCPKSSSAAGAWLPAADLVVDLASLGRGCSGGA